MKYRLLLPALLLFVATIQLSSQPTAVKTITPQKGQLPYDRIIKPAGDLIILGDSAKECHALDCSLSPDKNWLAVEERYSIGFINTQNNKLEYRLPLDSIPGLRYAMCTYSGIIWYRKDQVDYVLFSASKTSAVSYVVMLKWNGSRAEVSKTFRYKPAPPAGLALPNELLARNESGRDFLYVVLNGNNQLVKQDLFTGDTIWVANTGTAPYGIAGAHEKIYVTNWAGGIPDLSDKNVAGIPWGSAKIDPANAATREGSVSVIDPASGKLIREIIVGLHPNKIVTGPGGNFVYLTCSNSDQVIAIDTRTDKISETISLRILENENSYSGDTPNSLTTTNDGKTIYVANGMDNAVAVIKLGSKASTTGTGEKSVVQGFIPTAAFPSSVALNEKSGILYVTNLESYGPDKPFRYVAGHEPAFNSHHQLASVSVIPVPNRTKLAEYTTTVIAVNQMERLASLKLPPRPEMAPKPVPDRIGEPSVFKHVLYIIKENRTYDQVLGDVKKGDGDKALCTYGENVTPNTHRLVDQFQLMDNFFVSGKCSAEGHSWTDASIVTDYIEKNVRAWFRSYPHVQQDALVYPSSGFIWDNAREHGVSVRIYGEASVPEFHDTITWSDFYDGFTKGKPVPFKNTTTLNTVRPILSETFPAYDGQKIPDVIRAKAFIDELKGYESMPGDKMPQLMVMALPSDHTIGTSAGYPTPRAMIADNDLALGQIIEALSHSRFWDNTVVFVVEDDSQSGWDHVSAFRTVAMVISPWSRFKDAIHTPYNQPSMVRTIEQILGLHPMNIQDAIAVPMTACFTSTPDFSPFTKVMNIIPLDEMNKPLTALSGKALHYARLSMDPQFQGIDKGNDDLFNRILWFAAKGNVAYPEKFSGNAGDDD